MSANSFNDWLEKYDRANMLARLITDAALLGHQPFEPWEVEYQRLRGELWPERFKKVEQLV